MTRTSRRYRAFADDFAAKGFEVEAARMRVCARDLELKLHTFFAESRTKAIGHLTLVSGTR